MFVQIFGCRVVCVDQPQFRLVGGQNEPANSSGQQRYCYSGDTEQDLEWMQSCLGDYDVTLNEQPDTALLAVQGPDAKAVFKAASGRCTGT